MTLALGGTTAGAGMGVDSNPAETQKSLAASIAALANERTGAVEYRREGALRVAAVNCACCGCKTDIHQSRAKEDAEWSPDALKQWAIFGWVSNDMGWFCSQTCAQRYAHKMGTHGKQPLPVATRVNSPGFARALYTQRAQTTVDPPSAADVAAASDAKMLAAEAAARLLDAASAVEAPTHDQGRKPRR